MIDETIEGKHRRAVEIKADIARLEEELREIYNPMPKGSKKKRAADLPPGFSLKGRVLEYIASKGVGGKVGKSDVKAWIKEAHGVAVSDNQVQGALSNLKAEGKLDIPERGLYALKP